MKNIRVFFSKKLNNMENNSKKYIKAMEITKQKRDRAKQA
jgi:hypothetical protein